MLKWFGNRPTVNPDGSETDWDHVSQWELLGHYSTALYGALWAYSGWDKVSYVNELDCLPLRADVKETGHLHLCRTVGARQATPTGHQQRNTYYSILLHHCKRSVLHIAAMERRIKDR